MVNRLNVSGLLKRYGLRAKKSWSQNFLVDFDVLNLIAEAAQLKQATTVVELGAGLGALTAMLVRDAPRVVAVERDRDLARVLRAEFALESKVEVMEANAATLDWQALCTRLGGRPVVVGNLPYHMATRILFHLVEAGVLLSHWVLMFQRELARRLLSGPGSREYGALSVLVQMRAEVTRVLDVRPESFFPAPKVHSTVLRFRPLPDPPFAVRDWGAFERVVRAAFSQRRKMIRNGLLSALGPRLGRAGVERLLSLAGVDGSERAEQLSLQTFARMGDALAELSQ